MSATYMVELNKWGITEGLPLKQTELINGVQVNCYSNADYLKAYNNIRGFNNAISWASSNGYGEVVIPYGKYAICYSMISDNDKENSIVINYNNLTLDMNNSTFKVIFDSVKRSPYDKMKSGSSWIVNTAAPYTFKGMAMIVRDCSYVTVCNGKIIGDKVDRDFQVQAEKAVENTYGIASGGNCKFIQVENNDVSFFMGDALTSSVGLDNVHIKTGYDMGWKLGTIGSNGAIISSTTECVSDFIAVAPKTFYFLQGYGYT